MEWTPPFNGVRLLPKFEWAILPDYATEASMTITTVGLDLAKNVFQVHGVNERGAAVLRKQLKRDQVAPFFSAQSCCRLRHMQLIKKPPGAGVKHREAERVA